MNIQKVSIKRGIECIHVETELGIVNIFLKLRDWRGRSVETIQLIPENFSGEKRVIVSRGRFVQLKAVGQRRKDHEESHKASDVL